MPKFCSSRHLVERNRRAPGFSLQNAYKEYLTNLAEQIDRSRASPNRHIDCLEASDLLLPTFAGNWSWQPGRGSTGTIDPDPMTESRTTTSRRNSERPLESGGAVGRSSNQATHR